MNGDAVLAFRRLGIPSMQSPPASLADSRHIHPAPHAYDTEREARREAHFVQSPRKMSSHSRRIR